MVGRQLRRLSQRSWLKPRLGESLKQKIFRDNRKDQKTLQTHVHEAEDEVEDRKGKGHVNRIGVFGEATEDSADWGRIKKALRLTHHIAEEFAVQNRSTVQHSHPTHKLREQRWYTWMHREKSLKSSIQLSHYSLI